MIRSLNQIGDTIVEVMIATAVVSSVMGSAFVLVNNSLQNTRAAQEHQEALKLVEGQAEYLRSHALDSTVGGGPFSKADEFCYTAPETLAEGSACTIGSVGYRLSITGASNNFILRADWEGPRGTAQKVEIMYKVFPGK